MVRLELALDSTKPIQYRGENRAGWIEGLAVLGKDLQSFNQ